MRKQLLREFTVSDFSTEDKLADGKVYPTLKDATQKELKLFKREIRWCPMFGGDMSGKHIALDPSYSDAVVTLVVKIDQPGQPPAYIEEEVRVEPLKENSR